MKKEIVITCFLLSSISHVPLLHALTKADTFFENKTGDTIKVSVEDMKKGGDLIQFTLGPNESTSEILTSKTSMTRFGPKTKFVRYISIEPITPSPHRLPTFSLILDQKEKEDKEALNQINKKIDKEKKTTFLISKAILNDQEGNPVAFQYDIE